MPDDLLTLADVTTRAAAHKLAGERALQLASALYLDDVDMGDVTLEVLVDTLRTALRQWRSTMEVEA